MANCENIFCIKMRMWFCLLFLGKMATEKMTRKIWPWYKLATEKMAMEEMATENMAMEKMAMFTEMWP